MPTTVADASSPGVLARRAAADVLVAVLDQGRALDDALERDATLARLAPRDRGFARAIAATALRRLGRIDAALNAHVDRTPPPAARALLRVGAAQILFLETPPHAGVGETVAAARARADTARYAGLTNAVLRRVAQDGAAAMAALGPEDDWPAWLMKSWRAAYGAAQAAALADASGRQAPLDLTVKSDAETWAERLGGRVVGGSTVRLAETGDVTALPGFGEGAWWVQDAAAALPAQLLVSALERREGARVLDLCAAPGGKTLQLAAAGCAVTAVDRSAPRLQRLRDNLARTGLSARLETCDGREAAALAARDGGFDAALVDAPCSATGTLRRRPDVAWAKTPQDVTALARVQTDLLVAAAQAVRPGGIVVYCTCSLQPEEGAPVVTAASEALAAEGVGLAGEPTAAALPAFAEAATVLEHPRGGVRTFPLAPAEDGTSRGADGFFMTKLRRGVL